MVLKCLFGHAYQPQKNECKEVCAVCGAAHETPHRFNGCRCMRCGATRDEGHNWDGCICKRCGVVRDKEHDWDGCYCKVCKKTHDEDHHWHGCRCTTCGATRDEKHDWDGCHCKICGKTRDDQHLWDGCKCKVCGIANQTSAAHQWNIHPLCTWVQVYHGYYRASVSSPIMLECAVCHAEMIVTNGTICPKCFGVCSVNDNSTHEYWHEIVNCSCGYNYSYERSDMNDG